MKVKKILYKSLGYSLNEDESNFQQNLKKAIDKINQKIIEEVNYVLRYGRINEKEKLEELTNLAEYFGNYLEERVRQSETRKTFKVVKPGEISPTPTPPPVSSSASIPVMQAASIKDEILLKSGLIINENETSETQTPLQVLESKFLGVIKFDESEIPKGVSRERFILDEYRLNIKGDEGKKNLFNALKEMDDQNRNDIFARIKKRTGKKVLALENDIEKKDFSKILSSIREELTYIQQSLSGRIAVVYRTGTVEDAIIQAYENFARQIKEENKYEGLKIDVSGKTENHTHPYDFDIEITLNEVKKRFQVEIKTSGGIAAKRQIKTKVEVKVEVETETETKDLIDALSEVAQNNNENLKKAIFKAYDLLPDDAEVIIASSVKNKVSDILIDRNKLLSGSFSAGDGRIIARYKVDNKLIFSFRLNKNEGYIEILSRRSLPVIAEKKQVEAKGAKKLLEAIIEDIN